MKLPVSLLLFACTASVHAEDALTLGAGLAATPRYSGSHEMRGTPVLVVDYQLANGFYASTIRGLGYGTGFGALRLNAALGMRGKRSDDDSNGIGGSGSSELRGMGEVKSSATLNLGAHYSIFQGLDFSASTALPISHRENGKTAGFELSGTLHADERDKVTLSLGASLADSKYMQTYYGVTSAQAARTGFKAYKPAAGLYEAKFTFGWEHRIDQRWAITGMLGSSTLVRDAANSPVTRRTTAPTAAVFASYRY